MSKLISGYWWAWRETEAGKKSIFKLLGSFILMRPFYQCRL